MEWRARDGEDTGHRDTYTAADTTPGVGARKRPQLARGLSKVAQTFRIGQPYVSYTYNSYLLQGKVLNFNKFESLKASQFLSTTNSKV